MDTKMLEKAVKMAVECGYAFLATANGNGQPNIAAVGEISIFPEGRLALKKWFCPSTISNIMKNDRVSLVVWDSRRDTGYQLYGRAEEIEDLAMLDGFAPGEDTQCHYPQMERQLTVDIDEIFAFQKNARCNNSESICP